MRIYKMLQYLPLLNKDYVKYIESGKEFAVEEKNPEGKGKCFFRSDFPVLFIKARDRAPVIWALQNRKCAEAAFITIGDNEELNLHIVEMKSKVSLEDFLKVIKQWEGMYLSVMGILGILCKNKPKKIFVYLAYKEESIQSPKVSTTILLKTPVGGGQIAGLKEWKTESVSMPHDTTATIVKGLRSSGDYDFGSVV